MLPTTVLRIANDEEFRWLVQSELKAIKDELKYGDKDCGYMGQYRGYLNVQGKR